ncbi:helix-turn-helix transcriptional regulator [Luteimonas wenzhouensis]|jgi:prophage regulatory protein|uniref:AlpA family transcriptional regulator n=1 Tax=Luteimonas wenzhouensis TaxID=2599615 RepID=A0A5C5U2I3_9GAMM|nr:AlpA family transcriptional regulator [Luteimonas wenzhouensis]TWT19792.1 AlpA family transcriptional regulator [Luteimonas wenzhouensis]
MHNTRTAQPRLIRLKEVMHLTGLSRSTIYSMMDAGTFPRQRKVTPTIAVWSEAEVLTWAARVLGQDCEEAATAA